MEPKVEQRCYRRAGLGSSVENAEIPCGDFTKDVESIIAGLVLNDYFLHTEKTKSTQNVIILQNRKDAKLSSWNTERSFENCIETCHRCKNINKRTKRLLKNISTPGKRKTLGFCSNCGIKIQTDPSHCKCNDIFKTFLTSSAKDLDIDEHDITTCLSKPNDFTIDFLRNEADNNHLKLQPHSYSDSYLNKASEKYYGPKSSQKPTDGRQVKIRPLIQSEIDLSKLYMTRTCHSFLQEQKTFRKTRLRIRKQPHDQTFQFHFIFPSKKKDLDSRPQVSSSQLLHDIQVNRKTNIIEKKNLSAKTNKKTLPWQGDFSVSSLQGISLEFLYDIHAKYGEIKTLEDKILEERRSRDLEKKNLGAKSKKQTLPWQSDFSLLSLEGKTLELLHDIRAKYMETKILEDKILDLGKVKLGVNLDNRILPWKRDSSLLGLEGDSLELLHDIQGKYRNTKILESKILAERYSSDLKMKKLGAKTNKQTLPWQGDSSLLGLKGNSLELIHDIRGKYIKTKVLENKILAERHSSDLEMKNLGAKTNKQTLPWQRDSSLTGLKGNSKEPLHDIRGKYRKTKVLENKILAERYSSDLEMKNLGAKTNKQTLPWQRDSSLLGLKGNSKEPLHDIRGKYRKEKILENKILAERYSSDLEMKKLSAKTNKQTLPWQSDSSLLGLKGNSKEPFHDIRGKYRKEKILENKILAERYSSDLEMKKLSAKTNKQTFPWQGDSSLLGLKGNSKEPFHDIRGKYRKEKILENKILAERYSSDLEMKKLSAKTNKQTFPWQGDSSLLGLKGNSLELSHDIRGKYNKTKVLENKILAERHSSDLEMKNLGAKTNKQTLPSQRDSSLLSLKENSLQLLNNIQAKYKNKKRKLELIRDLINKSRGIKTEKHRFLWQKDYSLLSVEAKYEEKQKRSADQRNRDLEKKVTGVKTKKHELPWQKDYSYLNLEVNYEEKQKHLIKQHTKDFERKKNYPKTKDNRLPPRQNEDLKLEEETGKPSAKTKKHELSRQNNHSLLNLEAKHEEKQKRSADQRDRDLEKKIPSAKTKKHELSRQNNHSLLKLEAKHEEKPYRSADQRNRNLEKKIPSAKTKKHELSRQNNHSLLKLEAKHEEKQNRSADQRNRALEKKIPSAKTKKHELSRQNNHSLLNLEAKHEEKQNRSADQRNRDLEKKVTGVKTKKHWFPFKKDYSYLNLEVNYEEKQKHLVKQHTKDLEKKKNYPKTKDNRLPPRQNEDLKLEEETATITQANVIDEQTKRYHKKKHGLNKKEDSFNELNDGNSEINVRLVRRTSEEIEERRKKKQAILEMLIRMGRKNTCAVGRTVSHDSFLNTIQAYIAEKAVRKMNVYRMTLSRPEFDWFAKNKGKKEKFYDSGEIFATFSEDGCGQWFYRDGKLALDYYNTEKTPPGRRYVVYSRGKPDRKGRPRPQTVLASFDHSGNAVVFDHAGNIRLKYDQNEGVVLDPSIGPQSHWKWHSHYDTRVTSDTEMPFADPETQMSEDGLGKGNEPSHKQRVHKLELKKSVLEKSKKMNQSYKRFEIKMKALKINENISLKILDQAKVYLIFSDDTTHIKINIGMKFNTFNRNEIVDVATCYVGDVFNPLEKFPADTHSVLELQRTVALARQAEQVRVRRLGRLMRPVFFY